jgi:hypothetical protein
VGAASRTGLTAEIFLHQKEAAGVSARLFRIVPGRYRLTVVAGERTVVDRQVDIPARDHRLTVEFPGNTLLRLTLAPANAP